MMDDRPRIGVLLLASGWMRDVGLSGSTLEARVSQAAAEIRGRLAAVARVVAPAVVASAAEAARAAAEIAAAGCHCAVVAPLVWCEDAILRTAVVGLGGMPILLCTLLPTSRLAERQSFEDMLTGSGVVGTLQASGMLRREGMRFASISGHYRDPAVYEAIGRQVRACAAAAGLRGARIGLLPGRCDAMSVTWVDEFGLRARHGVDLVPLPVARLVAAAAAASAADVAERRRALVDRGFALAVDPASLEQAIRSGIGLAALAAEERLEGVALNDLDEALHRDLGLRPCLPDPLAPALPVSMEADVASCVAMVALRRLTAHPAFYGEIYSVDLERSRLLVGHAGWHDPAARDPAQPCAVVADEEYRRTDRLPGAAICFKVAPGPVTLVNAVWRDRSLAFSTIEGESLAGPPAIDGSCHLLFQAGESAAGLLDRLICRGVSQHWVSVPGRRGAEVAALAMWMRASHEA